MNLCAQSEIKYNVCTGFPNLPIYLYDEDEFFSQIKINIDEKKYPNKHEIITVDLKK